MAATKGLHWSQQRFRERIKVGMLGKRLQDQAFDKLTDKDGNPTSMSKEALIAAKLLLERVVPALTSTEHTGTVSLRPAQELTDQELAAIAQEQPEAIAQVTPVTLVKPE